MFPTNRIHRNSGTPAYRSVMNATTALMAPLTTAKDNLRSQMQYPTVQLLPGLMASMLSTQAEHYKNDQILISPKTDFVMAIFSAEEAKKILTKVLGYSKADDCEV